MKSSTSSSTNNKQQYDSGDAIQQEPEKKTYTFKLFSMLAVKRCVSHVTMH